MRFQDPRKSEPNQAHGSVHLGHMPLIQPASVINKTIMGQRINSLMFTGMTVTYATTQLHASSMLAKNYTLLNTAQTITGDFIGN